MTGVGTLLRLALRRDRVVLPLWVFCLGILPYVYLTGFQTLFATDQERIDYARISADNVGFVGLYGPLQGDSLGELTVWRGGFQPVLIGLAALLSVIRHTRTDEEAGRTELIRAAVVGRWAQLAAALLLTGLGGLLLGLLATATTVAAGEPVAGSIALGVVYTLDAWVFAAVGAAAAQITETARGARGIAIGVLGGAYVLRLGGDISAMGDGNLAWLSWLSPVGWAHRVFPYGANDHLPAVLSIVAAVAVTGLSAYLMTKRDLGGGLLAARLGPPTAAAGLRSPVALAWRLHRGLLLGWTLGFTALGLVFGGVAGSVAQIAEDSGGVDDIFTRMGGTDEIVDGYFGIVAALCGVIAACYAVQATLRMRDEEQNGHAEALLSTGVSRYAFAGSHLLFGLLGPAVVLLAEGLASGLVHGDVGPVLAATMVQLPAVWVPAGVALLLTGFLPRLTGLSWAVLGGALLLMLAGPLLRFDQWVMDLSPFTHVPQLPGADFTVLPLAVLTVVAAVLAGVGTTGLRRRDLPL
ncbi:ABC transporter permease [Actinoplanes rectilineatus]|uniref:ABC transporter permease n=1 Tax=Actinoplanes rectilineatus TaxID=113571 RepID=UPI0005F2B6AC|nr:ABC transporter permease [Actinoplanes rectilineatus]